jgi:hypothetical protein
VDLGALAEDRPLDVEAVATERADRVLERVGRRHQQRPEWAAAVRERAITAARERLPDDWARMRETHRRVLAERAPRPEDDGGPDRGGRQPPGLAM